MGTVLDAATAVHHTATTDEPWDGPAAVKAMPNSAAALRACHAWVDPDGDPDAKTSYKFPHHKSKGGPANLAACRNGLARLSGANIPDADRAGVKRHLQAHLDDAKGSDDMVEMRRPSPLTALVRPDRRSGRPDNLHGSWYRIVRNAAAAEVFIYDEIGWGGITAADFVGEFRDIGPQPIDLHINSGGGDVFDGIAIYNAIQAHPAAVTVHVDGLAASAASFIAQAGDRRIIARNASMMIHDARALCYGDEAELRELADLVGKASDNIASLYAERAGGDAADWRAVMRKTAWYSADETVAAGLADEVAPAPTRNNLVPAARAAVEPPPATQPIPPTQPPPPPPPAWDAAAIRASLREVFQ